MKKNKSILLVLLVGILVLAVGIFTAVRISSGNRTQFYSNGYLLSADSTDSGVEVKQLQFTEGTAMKAKYPSSVEFRDIQGTTMTVFYFLIDPHSFPEIAGSDKISFYQCFLPPFYNIV